MSMLAMAAPAPHPPFRRDYAWGDARSPEFPRQSRPRTEPERIALPSIRQTFPDLLQVRTLPDGSSRAPSSATSPVVGAPGGVTPPEYVHSSSSNKRQRLSTDERDERASQLPRLYISPPRAAQRREGGGSPGRAPRSAVESWPSSSGTSPFLPTSAPLPSMRSPAPLEPPDHRADGGPTLPSLPLLNFEREPAPVPRPRGYPGDDYAQVPSRPVIVHPSVPSMEPAGPGPRQGAYPFAYHHPNRVQSLSLGSLHPVERNALPPALYGPGPGPGPYRQEYMRSGEFVSMGGSGGGGGGGGDNKQRKRRGNLPKETTDKLRAWFVTHLHHPYPTEDEKQDLVRQTGLQINQISNWFINARRRQLPSMRAESDAAARGADNKAAPPAERGAEYDDEKSNSPLSEGAANNYDDDFEGVGRPRSGHMKRGSV